VCVTGTKATAGNRQAATAGDGLNRSGIEQASLISPAMPTYGASWANNSRYGPATRRSMRSRRRELESNAIGDLIGRRFDFGIGHKGDRKAYSGYHGAVCLLIAVSH
jgi:hypothetical protein